MISQIFFNLYIDPMRIQLRESRIACHRNYVSIGALAYADDETSICPSLRGLNKMLEICNKYAAANHIYCIYYRFIVRFPSCTIFLLLQYIFCIS